MSERPYIRHKIITWDRNPILESFIAQLLVIRQLKYKTVVLNMTSLSITVHTVTATVFILKVVLVKPVNSNVFNFKPENRSHKFGSKCKGHQTHMSLASPKTLANWLSGHCFTGPAGQSLQAAAQLLQHRHRLHRQCRSVAQPGPQITVLRVFS